MILVFPGLIALVAIAACVVIVARWSAPRVYRALRDTLYRPPAYIIAMLLGMAALVSSATDPSARLFTGLSLSGLAFLAWHCSSERPHAWMTTAWATFALLAYSMRAFDFGWSLFLLAITAALQIVWVTLPAIRRCGGLTDGIAIAWFASSIVAGFLWAQSAANLWLLVPPLAVSLLTFGPPSMRMMAICASLLLSAWALVDPLPGATVARGSSWHDAAGQASVALTLLAPYILIRNATPPAERIVSTFEVSILVAASALLLSGQSLLPLLPYVMHLLSLGMKSSPVLGSRYLEALQADKTTAFTPYLSERADSVTLTMKIAGLMTLLSISVLLD